MAQNGLVNIPQTIQHIPHDSALSVGSSTIEDAAKIRDLEDEVRQLAEKANVACEQDHIDVRYGNANETSATLRRLRE